MAKLTQEALQASIAAAVVMLGPIRRLIDAGETLEAIRDGLLEAYPEMGGEDMAELIYQASLLAYMKGRERGD